MVTSDQPCFDTGTSTRGLSTGLTVEGTGSSLVQTTGEAAQRVHREVAVTGETLIYSVQNFRPVPVLFRLPVGSPASDEGHRHQFCSDCWLWFTQKSSKGCTGFPVTELLVNTAGPLVIVLPESLPVPESTSFTCTENYQSRSLAGSGVYQLRLYRELPVPECCLFAMYQPQTQF